MTVFRSQDNLFDTFVQLVFSLFSLDMRNPFSRSLFRSYLGPIVFFTSASMISFPCLIACLHSFKTFLNSVSVLSIIESDDVKEKNPGFNQAPGIDLSSTGPNVLPP